MKLNELLNIKYPIIQGGMANIASGEFAAAVSNAGGLGLIGAGGMDVETLKEHIHICKQKTKSCPVKNPRCSSLFPAPGILLIFSRDLSLLQTRRP